MTTTKPKLKDLPLLPPGSPKRSMDRKWHIGSFGGSGSGKTLTAASCGKIEGFSPVLVIDMDQSDVTIDSWQLPEVTVLRVVEHHREVSVRREISLWAIFEQVLDAVEAASKLPDFPYQMVVFDGCTALFEWCEDAVIEEALAKPVGQQDGEIKEKHDEELSSWADYRRLRSRMAGAFWRIKQLPVHTWVTAREKQVETEESTPRAKKYRLRPDFPPAVGNEFEAIFDVILHHSTKLSGVEEQFVIHTKLSTKYSAKSRAKGFPAEIICTGKDPFAAGKVYEALMPKKEV